jgi:hypothetical protein
VIKRTFPQALRGFHSAVWVPYVRTRVRGPKTMGEAHHSFSFRTLLRPGRASENLRKHRGVSLAVGARDKQPKGPALTLLNVIRHKGFEAIL